MVYLFSISFNEADNLYRKELSPLPNYECINHDDTDGSCHDHHITWKKSLSSAHDDVLWSTYCRRSIPSGKSDVLTTIGLIGHDFETGYSCFFTTTEDEKVDEASDEIVRKSPEDQEIIGTIGPGEVGAEQIWLDPANYSDRPFSRCMTCHSARPFILSPGVMPHVVDKELGLELEGLALLPESWVNISNQRKRRETSVEKQKEYLDRVLRLLFEKDGSDLDAYDFSDDLEKWPYHTPYKVVAFDLFENTIPTEEANSDWQPKSFEANQVMVCTGCHSLNLTNLTSSRAIGGCRYDTHCFNDKEWHEILTGLSPETYLQTKHDAYLKQLFEKAKAGNYEAVEKLEAEFYDIMPRKLEEKDDFRFIKRILNSYFDNPQNIIDSSVLEILKEFSNLEKEDIVRVLKTIANEGAYRVDAAIEYMTKEDRVKLKIKD